MKAIIGGTGIDQDSRFLSESTVIDTEYGSAEVILGDGIAYLPRHLKGHKVRPDRISYRANIAALESLGVDEAVSIYAVGSITDRIRPGSFGLVSDFIDFFSSRENSFFSDRAVHASMEKPFDEELMDRIASESRTMGFEIDRESVYAMTNGPRLETAAEIRALGILGADVVGMTLGTEAALLREKGIRNAAIAYSINWACGIDRAGFSFLSDDEISALSSTVLRIAERALSPRT